MEEPSSDTDLGKAQREETDERVEEFLEALIKVMSEKVQRWEKVTNIAINVVNWMNWCAWRVIGAAVRVELVMKGRSWDLESQE
jgi:hypothetical protein